MREPSISKNFNKFAKAAAICLKGNVLKTGRFQERLQTALGSVDRPSSE